MLLVWFEYFCLLFTLYSYSIIFLIILWTFFQFFRYKVPPDIIDYQTSHDMVVDEGQNVTLTCTAVGLPEPTIEWRREGRKPLMSIGSEESLCIICFKFFSVYFYCVHSLIFSYYFLFVIKLQFLKLVLFVNVTFQSKQKK